jgi:hypothetical protein
MTVDNSKLRSVTARQLASALQLDGFQLQNFAFSDLFLT